MRGYLSTLPPSLDREILDLTLALQEEVQRLQVKYSSSFSSSSFFNRVSLGHSHKIKMEALLNIQQELKQNTLGQTGVKFSGQTMELVKKAYVDNYSRLEKEDIGFCDKVLGRFLEPEQKVTAINNDISNTNIFGPKLS